MSYQHISSLISNIYKLLLFKRYMAEARLYFDDDLWQRFKNGIPRNMNINTYMIELIKKDIEKKEAIRNGTN